MSLIKRKTTLPQLQGYLATVVNIDGTSRWDDLNRHQQKCILVMALECQLIDVHELWNEFIDISKLVGQTIEGIHDEKLLGAEILDRVEEQIAPQIDAMLHQTYLEYYGHPPAYDQEWLKFIDDEMDDSVSQDRRTMANEWNAERAAVNIPF